MSESRTGKGLAVARPRFVKSRSHLVGAVTAALLVGLGAVIVGPAVPALASPAPTPTIYTATDLFNTDATLNASVGPGGRLQR